MEHTLTQSVKTEADILAALGGGPVKSFGSDRAVDKLLQSLRKQGLIRYVKVKDGGGGWELAGV